MFAHGRLALPSLVLPLLSFGCADSKPEYDPSFTFFATSRGSGALGGNYGGVSGADAFCQELADSAGADPRTWRAYLSSSTEDARDRIGPGPWHNSRGETVATNVSTLHADGLSNGNPQHVLDELGDPVPFAEHDINTGSHEDGTEDEQHTCDDWTSQSDDQNARVGHSDIPPEPFSPSWNSAHNSSGCSEAGLEEHGGSGRIYCFAVD